MTKSTLAIALLALTLGACSSQAPTEGAATPGPATSSSAGLPAGNIAAGEKLSSTKGASGQACVDCHGAEGNAPIDDTYPKLGGQYHSYLAHSLQAYRSGKREHALMSSQAKELTDQQIADLAAYYGSRDGQLADLNGVTLESQRAAN